MVMEVKIMNYDDILHVLGGFEAYQKIVIALLMITQCFDGILTMMIVFNLGEREHRCRLPDIADDRYSLITEVHNGTAYNTSQCFLYFNETEIPCKEWVYDISVYTSTWVSKFNMVCKDKVLSSHILSAHFIGSAVNSLFCGFACDKYGRKPVLIVGILFLIVPNIIRPWMPTVPLVVFCELLNAAATNICHVVPFIIAAELVDPTHRELTTFAIYISYCFGEYVILLYAYFIRDWETLILVAAAPMTICFLIFLYVPESPRWLLIKGRTQQAISILHKMAKYNGTVIEFDPNDAIIKDENRVSIMKSFKIIITSKEMVKRFCILFFNWFSVSLIYNSISMNTGELRGDDYLDYFLSTTTETVGVLLCFFVERFPRKILFCPVMIIGGASCLSTIFPSMYGGKSLNWLTIGLAMVGKLGTTIAYFLIYLITSENFPTVIRSSAFMICNAGGGIGGIISPYIGKPGVLLDAKYGMAFPLLLCGSFGITAGFLSFFLPETRNIELPESFEEILDTNSVDETTYLKAAVEKIAMSSFQKEE